MRYLLALLLALAPVVATAQLRTPDLRVVAPDPTIRICDSDVEDGEDNCARIVEHCETTTSGSTDCNVEFRAWANGVDLEFFRIDADDDTNPPFGIPRTIFTNGVQFLHHVIMPSGANPNLASAAVGRMTIDTTELQLLVANGGAVPLVFDERGARDFRTGSPSARSYGWFRAEKDLTLSSVHCLTDTGTATLSVQECDATGASCAGVDGATEIVCDNNGQADDGAMSNPTIDAGDWVRVTVSGVASAPTDLALTIAVRATRK